MYAPKERERRPYAQIVEREREKALCTNSDAFVLTIEVLRILISLKKKQSLESFNNDSYFKKYHPGDLEGTTQGISRVINYLDFI